MTNTPSPGDRDTSEQDQFLTILSREDALARFEAALFPRAIASEKRPLADALGCALAEDVVAPIDVPPFDRSNVDGFAVRSADLAAAGRARRSLCRWRARLHPVSASPRLCCWSEAKAPG